MLILHHHSTTRLRGLVLNLGEIVPIFHTVFARVYGLRYHYAISELCKGLCTELPITMRMESGTSHHKSSDSPVSRHRREHRRSWSMSSSHQRCGDGEVSGGGVSDSEGLCEAPTFMWSGPQRWWCRPTLKVAATPCRCASTTIRLCETATLSGCQRLKEHVARDCSGRFG